MQPDSFQTHSLFASTHGAAIRRVLAAAIQAVDPHTAVLSRLKVDGDLLVAGGQPYDLSSVRRIVVAGAGKAGAPMARAVSELLGERISAGLVIVKDGHAGAAPRSARYARYARIEIHEAAHPVPDMRGVQATRRLSALLDGLTRDDLLICLISGGGSALLTAPDEDISLPDLQALTGLLLACGADINEINCLRKHLDQVKGGGLARRAAPARVLTLILSDVMGNPLDVIASGPCVPDPSTYPQALALLVPAANHLLGLPNGKQRFLDAMAALTLANSLCGTLDQAAALRTEIAFFSAIKAILLKHTTVDRKRTEEEKNSALKQILDNAVIAQGVTDIFALAGLEKPNIGLLSDAFLEDVRKSPLKNLALELLERLLRDEIRSHTRSNLVQQKKYTDRLLETLRKYHNRAIETAQVIEELIAMAKDFQEALKRHKALHLNPDEVAFYDALAERPEVLQQMGDATLKQLANELTAKLRESTTVDWQVRESVRAKMRLLIKRLLRKYKYPPEGQEAAVDMVLKQAEALADTWSAAA